MMVHYLNGKGEEKMLTGIIHLQNVDNRVFIANTHDGKEFTLLVERIEGIYYLDKGEMPKCGKVGE